MKRVLVIVGTRPEAIKLAPVLHTLRQYEAAEVTLCATGQHREMLADALATFDLEADVNLDVMAPGQHPSETLGRMLLKLHPLMADLQPHVVVVQGDTMSVQAGAMAGFLHRIPVAHVEAGLRTRDKLAPFPEEVNRRVTGVVADLHFAPTQQARDNLLREAIPPSAVHVTGNTVVDALLWMRDRVNGHALPAALDPQGRRLVLVTAHRRENLGPPLRELCRAVHVLAQRHDDTQFVYPVHPNPQVQATARELLADCPRVSLVDPVTYPQLVALLDRATLVLTDSGGVQEEAATLGRPTLIVRDKTERPELVQAGVAAVVGTSADRIIQTADRLLSDADAHDQMARPVQVVGDGHASQRIAEVLITGSMSTTPFVPSVAPVAVGVGDHT